MLRSDQVYLRRLERSDLGRCHEWINRPEIFGMMGVFGPRTRDEQEAWYDNVHSSRTNLVFALCLTSGDTHIGNLSLFDVDYVNRNAGLTIFIADDAHRGKGYGAESVALLCEYAFAVLNLERVYSKTDNPDAARMYERLGFAHEGTLRRHAYRDGGYVDKRVYGLLRGELSHD